MGLNSSREISLETSSIEIANKGEEQNILGYILNHLQECSGYSDRIKVHCLRYYFGLNVL